MANPYIKYRNMTTNFKKKPIWFKTAFPSAGPHLARVRAAVQRHGLHTVCAEAGCPNKNECWGALGTATFLILGNSCTRNCRFCRVGHGRPAAPEFGTGDGRSVAGCGAVTKRHCFNSLQSCGRGWDEITSVGLFAPLAE